MALRFVPGDALVSWGLPIISMVMMMMIVNIFVLFCSASCRDSRWMSSLGPSGPLNERSDMLRWPLELSNLISLLYIFLCEHEIIWLCIFTAIQPGVKKKSWMQIKWMNDPEEILDKLFWGFKRTVHLKYSNTIILH